MAWNAFCRAGLIFLLLHGLVWPAAAGAAGILLLASDDTELYTQFTTAFSAALAGYDDDAGQQAVDTVYLDAGESAGVPDTTRYRLVVTVGTRAATALVSRGNTGAVLYTLLPESVYLKLENGTQSCRKRSAIFIDQPIARQAHLAGALFPHARRLGVLLGPTSAHRQPEIDGFSNQDPRQIVVRLVKQEDELAQASSALLDETDLLLAVSDPLALNRENARWLLYAAYQRQLPVIGFSRAYVRAGAAAAVFSEPAQMAQQAAETAHDWLSADQACLPAPGYTRDFKVAINNAVCKSLGGNVVDEQELARRLQQQEQQR